MKNNTGQICETGLPNYKDFKNFVSAFLSL